MNIKTLAIAMSAVILALGLVAAAPRTNPQKSVAATRPPPVHTVIGATVPMPDFFGSMLITR